jgi:uncharacterized membrane protein YdbT with pleckstrin-like domain
MQSGNTRLRGFVQHLIGYFAVMAVLVAVNLLTTPQRPWFVWPLVAWMAPLAVHAAYAMHLFGKPRE